MLRSRFDREPLRAEALCLVDLRSERQQLLVKVLKILKLLNVVSRCFRQCILVRVGEYDFRNLIMFASAKICNQTWALS